MDQHEFTSKDNWAGSFYELGIAYRPAGDDRRILSAVRAMWHTPLRGPVVGPYGDDDGGAPLTPVALPDSYEASQLLYGQLDLPGRRTVGFFSDIPRIDVPSRARTVDWVVLGLPMGMVELAFPVTYPLIPANNPWMDELDHVLIGIAESVYRAVPFHLAAIGEEAVALARDEQDLTAEDLGRGGYLISPSLDNKLKPRVASEVLPTDLRWFPWVP